MANDLVSASKEKFPVGLAYDEAMNRASSTGVILFNDEELCAQWDISLEELQNIRLDSDFRLAVRTATYDLKENGGTVRAKMRAQFEYYLDSTIPQLIADDTVNPSVKASLISMLGKGSGMLDDTYKKSKQEEEDKNKPQVQPIQIVFANIPQQAVQILQPTEKVINP